MSEKHEIEVRVLSLAHGLFTQEGLDQEDGAIE